MPRADPILLDLRCVTPHFPGIGRYALNLARALAALPDLGKRRLLLLHLPHPRGATPDSSHLAELASAGAQLIPCPAAPFSLAEQILVPLWVARLRPAVVHFPYYVRPYILATPSVVTIHDTSTSRYPDSVPTRRGRIAYQVATRLAIASSRLVVTDSAASRDDLQRYFGLSPDRIRVVPLAADEFLTREIRDPRTGLVPPPHLPQSEIWGPGTGLMLPPQALPLLTDEFVAPPPSTYLLYVGINKPHKNLVRLIDAYHRSGIPHDLVLAGYEDPRYPEARQRARELGLSDRVRFLGPVDDATLRSLYAGATAFVFPSLAEGFGLPLLEAMASGIPAIAARAGSLPEIAGEAALLVDPLDVPALAEAIRAVSRDAALRADLAQRGRQQAARFTWRRTAEMMLAVYDEAIAAQGKRQEARGKTPPPYSSPTSTSPSPAPFPLPLGEGEGSSPSPSTPSPSSASPPPSTLHPPPSPLRILHVYKDYPPVLGGIEGHLRLLATRLAARPDLAVTVLVTSLDRRSRRLVDDGVTVLKAGRLATLASTPLSPSLFWQLGRLASDIVHLHFPYPGGELAYLYRGGNRPLITTYHSDVVRQRRLLFFYRPFLQRVLARADAIIATSPNYIATSPYLRPHAARCVVIPLGIDHAPFLADRRAEAAALRRQHGAPLLLFVGRFRYYKGLTYLLQALERLPSVHLLLVGSGPLELDLRRQASAGGLAARVHFAGDVAEADLPAYYQAADLFVLPAVERAEAFGITQIEAMASGLPIVCTEVGTGTSYVNVHGETGLVVPPRDRAALASAIAALLDDPSRRQAMADAGRHRAQTHFSADLMVDRTAALYHRVIEGQTSLPGLGESPP